MSHCDHSSLESDQAYATKNNEYPHYKDSPPLETFCKECGVQTDDGSTLCDECYRAIFQTRDKP